MREIRNDFIYVYVRNQRPKMENRSHSGDFLLVVSRRERDIEETVCKKIDSS